MMWNSDKNTQYYKKQEIQTKELELSFEASGIIEAISSVEIKSKASGEILFLGAEVGDFVDKGSVLGQIDQIPPKASAVKVGGIRAYSIFRNQKSWFFNLKNLILSFEII